jgi:hypothetical protein
MRKVDLGGPHVTDTGRKNSARWRSNTVSNGSSEWSPMFVVGRPKSLGFCGLGGPLIEEAGDDTLDQRDLGVLESLKTPAIELEAEYPVAAVQPRLDHFENAGLASTPVAMHADRDRMTGLGAQDGDDRGCDRFVV